MTLKTCNISLSRLKTQKTIEAWQEDYPRYRLFRIKYMLLGGLPAYFLDFGDEDDDCAKQSICSNNAVDIIQALDEQGFATVLIP